MAVGKIKLITKKHVSAGQVIIDVGINMTSDKKLTGDVDFENVKKNRAGHNPRTGRNRPHDGGFVI